MDNIRNTYTDEANELLNNLEVSLLALDDNPGDKSTVEEIFRAMHTLKGNSAMFGITHIADFVHELETIYDKIRNGEMSADKDILNITLACLDHLRKIIYDTGLTDAANENTHQELFERIKSFIHRNTAVAETTLRKETAKEIKSRNYYIYFAPNENIFDDGTNPLLLIMELAELGKMQSIPHFKSIDSIESYNPEKCITSWDVFLESNQDAQVISDVFVFVSDNAVIEINEIPFEGFIHNESFIRKINETSYQEQRTSFQEICSFLQSIGATPVKSDKTATVNPEQQTLTTAHRGEKKSEVQKKEKQVSNIRVSSDKLDELMNLVSELVTTQAGLSLFVESNKIAELESISENVEKLSRRLRDITFGMTLVPINNMFGRFQRMVRDVSNQLGKEVEFHTEGGETELDKTIIETLTDPLMHILRNSLDHGIETKEERIAGGKNACGRVSLKAYYSGVFVYIQISDDGKGINTDVIRTKAIQKGIIRQDDALSEREIYDLLFYPGFSTAQQITDISGRGVGMDVVKRNITDLKGEIIVSSKVNEGTTLTIKLPLTLSIIDGLLVDINRVKYIIPLSVIIKCYEVNDEDMLNNFNHLLILDEEPVPYINLRETFRYQLKTDSRSQIIVVSNGENKVGMSVDNIIGEYQAVVKPLGNFYSNQDFVSGATILGDGTIALVLDTYKIIKLYTERIKTEVEV